MNLLEKYWLPAKRAERRSLRMVPPSTPNILQGKVFIPSLPHSDAFCAREQWNITTGKPSFSEQLNLVNAWMSSPAGKGLLYVINIDDQQKPVGRIEAEAWVNAFEKQSMALKHFPYYLLNDLGFAQSIIMQYRHACLFLILQIAASTIRCLPVPRLCLFCISVFRS